VIDENSTQQQSVCYYGHRIKAINYSVMMWEELAGTSNNNDYTFSVNKEYDLLREAYTEFLLPSIKVKDEFRDIVEIKWPKKVGHAAMPVISIIINGKPGPTLTRRDLDIIEQYYLPAEHQSTYSKSIGDLDIYNTWTDHLPAVRITKNEPFFFFWDPTLALQIWRNRNTSSTIIFKPIIVSKVVDLLCYRERLPKPQKGYILRVDCNKLLGVDDKEHIKPLMRGRYVKLSFNEREILTKETPNYMNIPVFESEISDNHHGINTTVTIPLSNKFPSKALFFMAEGYDNKRRRITSNYTSSLDPDKGTNPCHDLTVIMDSQTMIRKFPKEHFENIESRGFPSAPREIGYNALRFCENKYMVDVEPGLDTHKHNISIGIRLQVDDPYELKEERPDDIINDTEYDEDTIDSDSEEKDLDPHEGREEESPSATGPITVTNKHNSNRNKTIQKYFIVHSLLMTRRLSFDPQTNEMSYPILETICPNSNCQVEQTAN